MHSPVIKSKCHLWAGPKACPICMLMPILCSRIRGRQCRCASRIFWSAIFYIFMRENHFRFFFFKKRKQSIFTRFMMCRGGPLTKTRIKSIWTQIYFYLKQLFESLLSTCILIILEWLSVIFSNHCEGRRNSSVLVKPWKRWMTWFTGLHPIHATKEAEYLSPFKLRRLNVPLRCPIDLSNLFIQPRKMTSFSHSSQSRRTPSYGNIVCVCV